MLNLTSKLVSIGGDDDSNKINYHLIEQKLSILPIVLTIVGTIGNLIAFYVLTRKKLRKQSTMLYFASLTCMDTLSLYQWNFNFFYKYRVNQLNQNLEDQSLFLCRYISFMGYFSMQTCALILVLISIDRYLIITNNNWKQKYSKNVKFNLFVIISAIFLVALINLPVSFLNGKYSSGKSKISTTATNSPTLTNHFDLFNQTLNNSEYAITTTVSAKLIIYTTTNHLSTLIPVHVTPVIRKRVECYTTSYIIFYQKITFLLECVIPLILMILFNYLLIKKTYNSSTKFSLNTPANHHVNSNSKKDENTTIINNLNNNKDSNSNMTSSNTHLNANLLSKQSNNNQSLKVTSSPTKNSMKKSASFHSNNLQQTPSIQNLAQNNGPNFLSIAKPTTARKTTAHVNSCYDLSQKKNLLHTSTNNSKISRLSAHRNSSIITRVALNENLPSDGSNSDNNSVTLTIPRVSSSVKLKQRTSDANHPLNIIVNNDYLNENNPINSSLANLDFLQYSPSIYEKNLTYIEPDSSYYLNKQTVIDEEEEIASVIMHPKNEEDAYVYDEDDDEFEEEDETGGELSKTKDSDQMDSANYNLKSNLLNFARFTNNLHASKILVSKNNGQRGRHSVLTNATFSTDHRRMSSLRNRRIVLMLSLLTISFAVSTLPPSVFYTFFRPILNKKPYRRLLSLSFNLLRHLSHTFNFIIYFTFSSVIKQQLKDTLNDLNEKILFVLNLKFFQKFCCCLIYIIPNCLKKKQQQTSTGQRLNFHKNNPYHSRQKNNYKMGPFKTDKNFNTEQSFVSVNVTSLGNNKNNTSNFVKNTKSIFKINNNNNNNNKHINLKKASLITNQNLNSIIDGEPSSVDITVSTPNLDVNNNNNTKELNDNNGGLFFRSENIEEDSSKKKAYETVSFKVPSSDKYLKKKKSNDT